MSCTGCSAILLATTFGPSAENPDSYTNVGCAAEDSELSEGDELGVLMCGSPPEDLEGPASETPCIRDSLDCVCKHKLVKVVPRFQRTELSKLAG